MASLRLAKYDRFFRASQVGATPEGVEVPRCRTDPLCAEMISRQPPVSARMAAERLAAPACRLLLRSQLLLRVRTPAQEHRATMPEGADPKWRFFWRIGQRPSAAETAFAELNAERVLPAAFPQVR